MARRRNTESKDLPVKLKDDEVEVAAARMMAGAQAHQRASAWCMNNPDANPPSIDAFFFPIVSFELILLSVEQSLRLLLLLHYSIIRDDTNHNPNVLYGTIRNRSGGKEGIRGDIVSKMNELGQDAGIRFVSEKELVACLRKHDSSYSNFRYFQLDHQARLNHQWEVTQRDIQIIHCLSLALIHLNWNEMDRRSIGVLQSMSPIPEGKMTGELKELKARLTSK